MSTNANNQLQLSQDLGNSATLEQALNNAEIHTPQALPAYYNKLHPFSLGEKTGLTLGRKQREKLRGIAQKLGIKMYRAWDISEATEEVKP